MSLLLSMEHMDYILHLLVNYFEIKYSCLIKSNMYFTLYFWENCFTQIWHLHSFPLVCSLECLINFEFWENCFKQIVHLYIFKCGDCHKKLDNSDAYKVLMTGDYHILIF